MSLNTVDYSKKLPKIKLFLAKPNKEIIGRIDRNIFNVNHSVKLKDINELRFNVAIQITKQHELVDNPYFKKIKQHYLLRVDYNGTQEFYKIQNIVKADRNKEEFSVIAYSLETELNGKKVINLEEKSINCKDILIKTLSDSSSTSAAENGSNSTTVKITNHGLANNDHIINKTRSESRKVTYVDANTFTVESITSQSVGDTIEKYKNATNWTIGTISDSFNTTYRDFESNIESALDYIQNTIATTFKGIATFDTNSRTISIVDESTIGSDKGLPVKFGQYMLGVEQDSNAQEIVTRLYCVGGKDSSSSSKEGNTVINRVNPSGTDYIDDFSHFMNEDYMSSGLISSLNSYNTLLASKKPVSVVAGSGTTETTLVMNAHGLVVNDFVVNRTRSRATRKVLTVIDVNTVTIASVTNQVSGDSIDKYPTGTFGRLLFQKEDYQADLITKNNELDTLKLQKLTVLDKIAIQLQAKTIDTYSTTITNTSLTRTLSGISSGDKYAAMVRVSSTVGTTVTLNGVNKTFTADAWNFLGKVTSATSHTIVVTTTGTNVSVKTLIVKITNDEYTGLVSNPITPPTLSQTVNGSSTLVAGTYYVKYSWSNVSGETLVSSETSVTVGTGYNLVVTLPQFPSGVTSANIYIGTTLGAETKQGNTTTTTYTQSIALVTGSSVPASNTATYANESTLIDTYSEDYKQVQIDSKQAEINTVNSNITSKDAEISSLRTSLSYESNFTMVQLDELKIYTYRDEFRDENIVDSKDLYDRGVEELKKRNIPQILYKIDVVAFEQSITEQRNWKKLNLGDTVSIRHDKLNINIKSKILEIERDFENTSVNLVIGNNKEILTDDDKLIKSIYSNIKTTNILNNKQSGYDTTKTNFTKRNDRISVKPANPTILSDTTAIDHVINDDGSVDVSFEWSYTGTGDAYDIDGFIIYSYSSSTDNRYVFGSTIANEQTYNATPDKRAFLLQSVPSNKYFYFGIEAYRVVDEDVNSNGILKSDIVQPSLSAENPYRPESNVAFAGNITGTISGTAASTVVSNANNGQTTFTQTANGIRNGTAIADPSITLSGTAIDHVINTDGSADVSFEWTYVELANSPIDGFGVVIYSDTVNTVHTPSLTDTVLHVDKSARSYIKYGVPANKYYTFGVFAYRIVDTTINSAGILRSNIVKSTYTGENPYQPSTSVAFTGDITGTIGGKPYDEVSKTTATFIVADGSTSGNTKRADYVVPALSTSAHTTINTAINALPSGGGKIVLLDGTFTIDGEILGKSNVELEGQGDSTIVKLKNNHNVDIIMIRTVSGSITNFKIKNIKVDGNKSNQTGGYQYGIYLNNVSNSFVTYCTVQNCSNSSALYIGVDSDNNTITDNYIYNNNYGIEVNGFLSTIRSKNNVVTRNKCISNYVGISVASGIKNIISLNICENNTLDGIQINQNLAGSSNIISTNNCNGNDFGIRILLSDNVDISDNLCSENRKHGIYGFGNASGKLKNCTIQGNRCINNSQESDNLYDNIHLDFDADYNTVQGNTCRKGNFIIHSGTAQIGSTSTTIVLSSSASSTDSQYNNRRIYITSGTGVGQNRKITGYVGGTKVATVDTAWTTTPDATSVYEIKSYTRYGIRINSVDCDNNTVINNDLYDSGSTGGFSDAGTGTNTGLSTVNNRS